MYNGISNPQGCQKSLIFSRIYVLSHLKLRDALLQ